MVYPNLLKSSLEEAFRDAEELFAVANPRSAKRFAEALEAMPGGNTRTVLHYTPFPLTITKGDGARLWDLAGRGVERLGQRLSSAATDLDGHGFVPPVRHGIFDHFGKRPAGFDASLMGASELQPFVVEV